LSVSCSHHSTTCSGTDPAFPNNTFEWPNKVHSLLSKNDSGAVCWFIDTEA